MGVDRSGVLVELRAMLEADDLKPAPAPEALTVAGRRAEADLRLPGLWGKPDAVEHIEDLSIESPGGQLRARLYRPAEARGTVLFFHGGGWVVGSIETHDAATRAFANAARANVLSLGYRRAPEHPFPAAVQDADAALDWLLASGGAAGLAIDRVVVAGESAGATLAAVLARHARDRGIPLAGQVLIYPVTDTEMASDSYRTFADGFYLTAENMGWFFDQYLGGQNLNDPDAAPLRTPDLSRLAPAFLMTAGHDPLRDQGRAYAARLVEAGNSVTYREVGGGIHGMWMMDRLTTATRELISETAAWIRSRLA
ncbi:alpha/beta hydrolase [Devosia sp. CN2-171]|uniref:alpha/beta hydrolase n=1 Tax=Devosia sp. CN2-171 TaxID=3400909 RepID=UPI003BF91146